jgi:hypothetical protein
VGLNSLKSLNLTNVYPNNKKNNNKVKSKPLELRSRVKITNESKVVQKYIIFIFWGRSARQIPKAGHPIWAVFGKAAMQGCQARLPGKAKMKEIFKKMMSHFTNCQNMTEAFLLDFLDLKQFSLS